MSTAFPQGNDPEQANLPRTDTTLTTSLSPVQHHIATESDAPYVAMDNNTARSHDQNDAQQDVHKNTKKKKKKKHHTHTDTQPSSPHTRSHDIDRPSSSLRDRRAAKNRAYSIGSASANNTRSNEYYHFPAPQTLHFQTTGIGLYSPLVGDRLTTSAAPKNRTIYDGVPSYLNPRLMRQRSDRGISVKSSPDRAAPHKGDADPALLTRSQSEKDRDDQQHQESIDESEDFGDFPLEEIQRARTDTNDTKIARKKGKAEKRRSSMFNYKLHSQAEATKEDAVIARRGSYSYKQADGTRGHAEWSLFNDELGPKFSDPTGRKSTYEMDVVSYVKTAHQKRLLEDFNGLWKRAYFALILLAVFNAFMTFGVSKVVSYAWLLESYIYEYSLFQVAHAVPAYLITLAFKLTLVLSAIWIVRRFAPGCSGSGIPELRAILSGIWIRYYLSKTTFAVKMFALTLSLSSGVPIGLEGPFIHLSSILARQLTKLNVFAHLDRKQMLSAACAGGLASVFGAPIGGVLFSIEVTSTYYPVTNYWTAFCCAMVGSTVTHVLQTLSPTSILLYQNSFSDAQTPTNVELLYFALLGLLCGVMGAGFVYCHEVYVDLRRKYQARYVGDNPYGIAVVVVVIFSTILFFIGDFAILPARKGVADMFNIEFLNNCDTQVFLGDDLECADCTCVDNKIELEPSLCLENKDTLICQQHDYCHCYFHDWIINLGLYANLATIYCLNYLFTICAVTLQYPCGIFSPVFTLGSVFGRLFGELFRHWFLYCDPRVYAVVGAAAMTASVTQTISPAVIALEITQDLSLAIPCLIAVIVSGGVSGSVIHSFYDSVLQLRGIPMLPIRPTVAYKRVFIKPKRKHKKKKTTVSPLALLSSKRATSPNSAKVDELLGFNQEYDMMHQEDQARFGIDSKPEIFDAENGRSNENDHVMVLNQSMHSSMDESGGRAKPQAMYRLLIADDVMLKEFNFVTIDPSPEELVNVLTSDLQQEWFPIVHTMTEAVLVGEARRSVLMDLLLAIDAEVYETEIPVELREIHSSFYEQSATQIKDKASIMNDSSLLNETMKEPKLKRAPTFKEKVAKWRKRSNNDEEVEMQEKQDDGALKQEEDAKKKKKKEEQHEEHRVKLTLMSPGFIERINLSPIQVISEMPLIKIYTLFHILKPQNVYVTKYSRLIGVINEVQLLQREFATQSTTNRARLYCLKCNKACKSCKESICCC